MDKCIEFLILLQLFSFFLQDEILKMWNDGSGRAQSRYVKPRRCPYESINEALYTWFQAKRAQNLTPTGPLIMEKARMLAEEMGFSNFSASNGWFDRWRKRYNILHTPLSGESADVDQATLDDWDQRIPSVIAGYALEDVFNCDETGLNYRTLPTKSYVGAGDSRKGIKLQKDRLTVLVACSATGERLPLLVIGKSANPRCFSGRSKQSLGVTWRHNKKAWMTIPIFTEWLQSLNNKMKLKGRSILLLIDNCPAHPSIQLSNVKVVFLPANTTSKLQPCDAGIIETMKRGYRKKFLRHLIINLDDDVTSARDLAKKVTVLDAIFWVNSAWKECKPEMIKRCWAKCGFRPERFLPEEQQSPSAHVEDLAESFLVEEEDFSLVLDGVSMEEYVAMDAEPDFQPLEPLSDELDATIEEPEPADEEPVCPPLTIRAMREQLRAIRDWAVMNGEQALLASILQASSAAEELHYQARHTTQKNIPDFFSASGGSD